MISLTLRKKNAIWNIIGASANAFTSLVFTMIATFINGTDNTGIFTYAFAVATIIFCFSNYITRPYQVTDISGSHSDSDYIYARVFTCLFGIAAALLFCVSNHYDIYKSAMIVTLCVYRTTEAFIETFYAIIQKRDFLYKAGISMFIRAVLCVAVFFISDFYTKNLVLACILLVTVNILCFAFYDFQNARKVNYDKSKPSYKAIKTILFAGFFNFVLTFLNSVVINVSRYAIDRYETNYMQAVFGYIIMPATFMSLFGQYIIQPVLTTLSNGLADKNLNQITGVIKRVVAILFAGGVVVFVIAYLLEVPVLSIVFGMDFSPYKTEMMIIIGGSVMFALETVVSTILVAFRKTAIQAVVFFSVTVASAAASFIAVKNYGLFGSAIVYSISMLTLSAFLVAVLINEILKYKRQWN